ncbi:MAG: HNH endonuclease [Leptolyngbyaceae cyanobacterium RM2_2_4]|nr:HNH endonuclease [Leptolyngbyaceae cyanobacterium RM2_2_4]
METAVSKKSKFRGVELHSRDIELVMRRFRRLIPTEIRPEVDHVLAIVLGGTALGLENHQILCAKCHKTKTKSDIKEKFSRNPNPRKGVALSEEHVTALSEARKGQDSDVRKASREKNLYPILRKPIVAINLSTKQEILFDSSEDAAKSLNLQISNVSRVLSGKQNRKQHKGWTFRYQSSTLLVNEVDSEDSGQNETDSSCTVDDKRSTDVSD